MSDETLNQEAVVAAPELEATAASNDASNQSPGEAESQEPRTFTQEELDRIVSERVAKAERKARREMVQAAEAAQRQAMTRPPDPTQYDGDVEAYAEDLAEFKAEQKIAEREQQKKQETVTTSYYEREDDARLRYPDFESVVYDKDLEITAPMYEVIVESEIGPEIAYHLGKNPGEAARIAALAPLAQAREIGKLEVKLSANPSAKKVSSAPEPIRPISGSRNSVPSYSTSDPRSIKMDPSEWIEKRNAEIAAKYR